MVLPVGILEEKGDRRRESIPPQDLCHPIASLEPRIGRGDPQGFYQVYSEYKVYGSGGHAAACGSTGTGEPAPLFRQYASSGGWSSRLECGRCSL